MIEALFETHINVRDLQRSMAFYGDVLGLEQALLQEHRQVAFYWIGGPGKYMLGVWEKPEDQVQRQHFAFQLSLENMGKAVPYLKERGLAVRNFLDDGTERCMVFGWMPAVAIYFRDPDEHSLEFIAMLPDPPRPDLGVVPWDEWESMHGRPNPE